ncbi:MAG: lipopolysaccharide assembly protein LapA domain-containing protein [Pseudomonadota bacterium]
MKRILVFIIIVAMLLLAAVVGSRNTELVTVNYLVAQSDMKMATLMMIMLLLGFFLGVLGMFSTYLSSRLKLNVLKRKLARISQDK